MTRTYVDWPEYPTLLESGVEKVVQIVLWDGYRWLKIVPVLSGEPDELLYTDIPGSMIV